MVSSISVVLPYFNESETIRTSFALMANQTRAPQEVIFVDSGSTDASFQILEDEIAQYRGPVKFINLPARLGSASSTRNAGYRIATSEYIAQMDCGLSFPLDWLERQEKYLDSHPGLRFVSAVVQLKGVNDIDCAASAHTFGYLRDREVLPESIVHRSVYDDVGYLIEGKRAGDDRDWAARASSKGIERGVNYGVRIKYIGTNYASTAPALFRKIALYSKFSWGLHNHITPKVYLGLAVIAPIWCAVNPECIAPLLVTYLILRGYLVPILKSKGFQIFRDRPAAIFSLPLVGAIIDLAKVRGYLQGLRIPN